MIRMDARAGAPRRLIGLLQSGYSAHGIATLVAVTAFVLLPMSPRTFAHIVAILLFMIGSVLAIDGALGLRSRVERIRNDIKIGPAAIPWALARIACGIFALMLCAFGLSI